MVRQSATRSSALRPALPGFSLVEMLIAVVLISALAGVAITLLTPSRQASVITKLNADVIRLNQIISMYLADGGSLDGVNTPELVIAKLKTIRPDADARTQVGVTTGRSLDIRLVPRMANNQERATSSPRAVWNASTKRFEISTTSGVAGVMDFVLDDSQTTLNFPTESRTRTALQYNDVNGGWVWTPGTHTAPGLLSPLNPTLVVNENVFDPTVAPPAGTTGGSTTSGSTTSGSTTSGSTTSGGTTSGSTTSGSTTSGSTTSGSTTGTPTTTLPRPINSPNGGTYATGAFPTAITINANGAPGSGSQLRYRINGGSWINYTGGFTINSGDKVESRNFTTDAVLYSDSSIDSDTYYKLAASFAGQTTPSWINGAGGPALVTNYNNTNPDSVTFSHGDTRLDLGGGEYLDAGVENTMTFNREQFSGVAPNTDFTLGTLVILNGTTFNDSEATSVTLKLVLNLNQPVTQSGTVNVNFTMVSTPNTSDRLASADTVTVSNPTTSYTVTTGGVTYTLQLKLVSQDPNSGLVNGNTFYIYEGASASATVVGQFKSNR
jgi:prepilin-type N-terminal cleavage/methylation domain-containing protein